MTSSTPDCRLIVVLAFICGSWNFADPFQINASSSTAGTTLPSIGHNDPARTTDIRHSGVLTSYMTPPSSVRSTSQATDKLHTVSSSGKMNADKFLPHIFHMWQGYDL